MPSSTSSPGGTCPLSAGSAPLCVTSSPLSPASTSAPSTMPLSTSETSCWPRASCPLMPSQVRTVPYRDSQSKRSRPGTGKRIP